MSQSKGKSNETSGLIYGRHASQSCLEDGTSNVEKIWTQRGVRLPKPLSKLIDLAKSDGAVVQNLDRQSLDRIADGAAHQGVIVRTASVTYISLQDWLDRQHDVDTLALILDGVQDPGNIGAIFRTASAAGVKGIILPKKGSAPLGSVAMKRSAGTLNATPAIRVTNIRNTIQLLQKHGFFVFGLSEKAEDSIINMTVPSKTAILVGSEDKGIRAVNAAQSDGLRSIPMIGAAGSLNVSAAVAVVLYELTRSKWTGSGNMRKRS